LQTPFDEALFEAVDEEGRAYTCRALLCFEREDKFFVLYMEEGADPVPQSLRAGYCLTELLEEGATVPLLPLENEEQWGWIHQELKEKIVSAMAELFGLDEDGIPSLYFDDGGSLDGDMFSASSLFDGDSLFDEDDFDEDRDLYAPDAQGNYLS